MTFTGAYQHTQTNKQLNYASNKREGGVHTLSKRADGLLSCALLSCALLSCAMLLVIADFVGAAGVLGQYLSGRQLPNRNVMESRRKRDRNVDGNVTETQRKRNGNVNDGNATETPREFPGPTKHM